jgi:hypothetical protein
MLSNRRKKEFSFLLVMKALLDTGSLYLRDILTRDLHLGQKLGYLEDALTG